MFYSIVTQLVLPPALFLVLLFVGLLLKWRWPRLGRSFLWVLLLAVYLCTTPWLAGELMAPLQPYGPVDAENPDPEAGAIVVLGAGIYFGAPEYREASTPLAYSETGDALSLERVEYAAWLFRMTGIPILVSGGSISPDEQMTVSRAMKQALERDFAVPVRWVEEESWNTWTNAEFSAELLAQQGVRKAYVVTHAWHMPRAMLSFASTGIVAIPAPTRYFFPAEPVWQDFFPSPHALLATYYAFHEYIGLLWYRLQY